MPATPPRLRPDAPAHAGFVTRFTVNGRAGSIGRGPEVNGMMISGSDWLVIVAGIAAIAWVNWYFFVAGRSPSRATVATMEGDTRPRERSSPGSEG